MNVNAPAIGLSERARRTGEQPISFLMASALANPDLISFAAGFVDPLTLPLTQTREIVDKILSDDNRGRAALQYDTTIGVASLRRALLDHLADLDGISVEKLGYSASDLIVTNGSQQGLYLAAEALFDVGDIVICEAPSYFVYTTALAGFGVKCVGVPMDDGGMDVDALEHTLMELKRRGELGRVKAIYTVDYYQNPTGLTLAAERRPKLVELARRFSETHRIVILEDAAYRELYYDASELPPKSIKSLDPTNEFVAYFGTFSKPYAPGLKLGYCAMPADLHKACVNLKGNHDFGSSSLSQHLALEAMKTGVYREHLDELREGYKHKADAMLAALENHMPEGVSWTTPAGGLYTWLTLGDDADTSRLGPLFGEAVKLGVLYVPGEYCFVPMLDGATPTNQMRLCFASVKIEQIEPGVKRLAEAVRSVAPVGAGR